jgi:hypothetical protein
VTIQAVVNKQTRAILKSREIIASFWSVIEGKAALRCDSQQGHQRYRREKFFKQYHFFFPLAT